MPPWDFQPAADLGLTPMQRLRSVRREQGLVSWSLRSAMGVAMATLFRTYNRMEVQGREKLPAQGPFILIGNHASHIDALVLASALTFHARQHVCLVAAGDVFFEKAPLAAASATLINAVPLWRKKVTTHALDELRTRLTDGSTGYILFPEGARTRDGKALPFKAGLGRLVCGTPVPIFPCFIHGAFDALRPGKVILRPTKLRVQVGDPHAFPDTPNTREGWEHVSTWAKQSLAALGPPQWSSAT